MTKFVKRREFWHSARDGISEVLRVSPQIQGYIRTYYGYNEVMSNCSAALRKIQSFITFKEIINLKEANNYKKNLNKASVLIFIAVVICLVLLISGCVGPPTNRSMEVVLRENDLPIGWECKEEREVPLEDMAKQLVDLSKVSEEFWLGTLKRYRYRSGFERFFVSENASMHLFACEFSPRGIGAQEILKVICAAKGYKYKSGGYGTIVGDESCRIIGAEFDIIVRDVWFRKENFIVNLGATGLSHSDAINHLRTMEKRILR